MGANNAKNSEIVAAQHEVERAKKDLAVRLRAASRSGKHMIERTINRTVETTKPLLIATAAMGAAAFVIGMVQIARRRSRPRRASWAFAGPVVPRQPSFFGTLMRSALASVAASLAGHLMERLSRSLESASNAKAGLPAAKPAASPPNSHGESAAEGRRV